MSSDKKEVGQTDLIYNQMTEEKQPAVFFASDKDKQKAQLICSKIIKIIEQEKDVFFKAYIMQMLLESFEETFEIDIKHGISFSETGEKSE